MEEVLDDSGLFQYRKVPYVLRELERRRFRGLDAKVQVHPDTRNTCYPVI